MASTIKIKRSSVAGKVPLTTDLTTGEIAINTKDKKLYSSNGTAVFEIGSQLKNLTVSGNTSVAGLIANGSLGTSGKVLKTNGTTVYWGTDVSTAGGGGFSNGQSISVTNLVVTANATISKLIANGSLGTAGYVLKSNGSTVYWSADVAGTVISSNATISGDSQSFTGNGSTSAFTLNTSIASPDAIVSINGLLQKPTTHYSISGTTLTFTSAPANNDSIEVRKFSGSASSFSDAIVSNFLFGL